MINISEEQYASISGENKVNARGYCLIEFLIINYLIITVFTDMNDYYSFMRK